MRLLIGIVCLLLSCGLGPVRALECSDVLAQYLAKKTDVQTSNGFDQAAHHFQCARSAGAHIGETQGGGGGSFLGVINAHGGGGSKGTDSHSTEDCGAQNAEQHESAFLYYSQIMYSDAINAWRECMVRREALDCWAQPGGSQSEVDINVRWSFLGTAVPMVRYSHLSVGQREVTPRFYAGVALEPGEHAFSVPRSPNDEISFILEAATVGMGTKTCFVYVPAVPQQPQPTPPQVVTATWSNEPRRTGGIPGRQCGCLDARRTGAPASPVVDPSLLSDEETPTLTLTNRCPGTVAINFQADSYEASIPLPSSQTERKFASATLPPNARLRLNLTGKLLHGYWVERCPTPPPDEQR